jgi:hypothetical protein
MHYQDIVEEINDAAFEEIKIFITKICNIYNDLNSCIKHLSSFIKTDVNNYWVINNSTYKIVCISYAVHKPGNTVNMHHSDMVAITLNCLSYIYSEAITFSILTKDDVHIYATIVKL